MSLIAACPGGSTEVLAHILISVLSDSGSNAHFSVGRRQDIALVDLVVCHGDIMHYESRWASLYILAHLVTSQKVLKFFNGANGVYDALFGCH